MSRRAIRRPLWEWRREKTGTTPTSRAKVRSVREFIYTHIYVYTCKATTFDSAVCTAHTSARNNLLSLKSCIPSHRVQNAKAAFLQTSCRLRRLVVALWRDLMSLFVYATSYVFNWIFKFVTSLAATRLTLYARSTRGFHSLLIFMPWLLYHVVYTYIYIHIRIYNSSEVKSHLIRTHAPFFQSRVLRVIYFYELPRSQS